MKILFAASEAFPLIKTGGLGDVAGSLPRALHQLGHDVVLLLPAYGKILREYPDAVARFTTRSLDREVRLLECHPEGLSVPVWLVDAPELFDRPGNPYLGPNGNPWPDNAFRYTVFAQLAVDIALGRTPMAWVPDIVHCNDWQTGLIPALLGAQDNRPGILFTIHNLAYQGLFPYSTFVDLRLPAALWSVSALEFWDQLSFMKGGLVFADRINTVSPTYAKEIQTPVYGDGLDGLLRYRSAAVSGIVNGIDTSAWNPEDDAFLASNYSIQTLDRKRINKSALQKQLGLPESFHSLLIGMVGRLVAQKGIDLVIEAMPELIRKGIQIVVLGTGDPQFESELNRLGQRFPRQVHAVIGYDEKMAHLIEAGADLFLMPSRFEPCGLNQMYSLRYGTVPLVRHTGGLADTVVNVTAGTLFAGTATGFSFRIADAGALLRAVTRALACYAQTDTWQRIQRRGMAQDFSWSRSAEAYQGLYRKILQDRSHAQPN